jgi:hypothetical protein
MLLQIPEYHQIVLKFSGSPAPGGDIRGERFEIIFVLQPQRAPQFGTLGTMVKELNHLLHAEGDAKAEDNGGDMDAEVSPGAYRRMDWMHVEHG